MPMNKTAFLAELDREIEIYPWAFDKERKARFMALARESVESGRNLVAIDGPAVVKAWQAIGGKGKPTYKALRALPGHEEEPA